MLSGKVRTGLGGNMHRIMHYIMENPVKANIVDKPGDFENNGVSFIRKGLYEVIKAPGVDIKLMVPEICL